MTPDEIRQLLFRVAKVMVPRFKGRDETPTARQKIEELEDYLLVAARWRASLEEARLYMQEARLRLEDEWEAIEGWQTVANGKTKQDMIDAKRTIRPDLYEGIRDAKFLIERLSEQIKRLERDEEFAVSRSYTMLTGG